MRITLVRHGETTGQSSIRYYGASDVPLSDTGRRQMLRVRDAIRDRTFDAVFTSRLRRSIEAAEIITAGRNSLTPVAAFDEIDFGRWEGWTREEIAERDPDNFRLWQEKTEWFRYPEGDSRADFHARVAGGLGELLKSAGGESVLMVLHRGVISVILAELLALSPADRERIDIALASIHVVVQNGNGWQAHVLDKIDHLTVPCAEGSPQ
jgi:broad specificity phosphatase PhoE